MKATHQVTVLIRKIVCILLVMVVPCAAHAQQVSATLSTASLPIGGQALLRLTAICNADQTLEFPPIDQLPSPLEVVEKSEISTTKRSDGTIVYTQTMSITCFDAINIAIKPLVFVDATSNQKYATNALKIGFTPVKLQKNDLIYDIKNILPLPHNFKDTLPLVMVAAIVMILAAALYFKPKRKPAVARPNKPIRRTDRLSAYEKAIQQLQILERNQVWNNNTKDYHTRTIEIINDYLHQEFGIITHEATTKQILEQIAPLLSPNITAQAAQIYQLSDFVKYAKYQPSTEENIAHNKATKTLVLSAYNFKQQNAVVVKTHQ
jgi:hypothetical protein